MGVSIWSLLIVLLIVALLFGTKRLRNIGGDLGSAIRGFKESIQEGEQDGQGSDAASQSDRPATIEHQHSEPVDPVDSEQSRSREAAKQQDG